MEGLGMTPNFWFGKRVFVTGHTGFKGSWLCLWLSSLGAKVVGFSLPPVGEPNLFDLAKVKEVMVNIEGDIRNIDQLNKALLTSQPEIVFHLAAQSLVRPSYVDPLLTYQTNVMGTANLLDCIRISQLPCSVVNITTDKCYENKEWYFGYREFDALGGFDPYSNSKACSELVTSSYRSSFFHPETFQSHQVAIATARAGNVIGGGDWAKDRLIPDVLKALEKNQPLDVRYPHAIRPWQHVLEPLHGYLMLAEKLNTLGPKFGKAWNFGPNDSEICSVGDVLNKLSEIWDSPVNWQTTDEKHPHETNYLKLDISLARHELGWQPMLSINKALQLVVEWEQSRLSKADMQHVSLLQIGDYQKMVTH
jgi:CDP-glucose 4,6-dehydratase